MRRLRGLASLFVLGSLACLEGHGGQERVGRGTIVAGFDGRPVGEPASEPVSLVELRRDPLRWLGRRVRFTLQLQRTQETWNPCLSRFGPGEWLGLAGWADESFPWEQAVFEDPATRLFVRRGGEAARVALQARPYSRLAVTATVREAFLDEPWLACERLEPLVEEIGEGTILHVGRALELADAGQLELALSQLERARVAPLPAHARAEIERLETECVRVRAALDARRRQVR